MATVLTAVLHLVQVMLVGSSNSSSSRRRRQLCHGWSGDRICAGMECGADPRRRGLWGVSIPDVYCHVINIVCPVLECLILLVSQTGYFSYLFTFIPCFVIFSIGLITGVLFSGTWSSYFSRPLWFCLSSVVYLFALSLFFCLDALISVCWIFGPFLISVYLYDHLLLMYAWSLALILCPLFYGVGSSY